MSCGVVDWANPCEAYAAVRTAYYDVLTGKGAQRLRFKSGESERDVTFNTSNIGALREEMSRLQMECARVSGASTGLRRVTIAG